VAVLGGFAPSPSPSKNLVALLSLYLQKQQCTKSNRETEIINSRYLARHDGVDNRSAITNHKQKLGIQKHI